MRAPIGSGPWLALVLVAAVGLASRQSLAKEVPGPTAQFAEPPKGAIVLFDGQDTSAWTTLEGKPFPWRIENGAIVCVPGKGNIRTGRTFGDCRLHIEFRTPLMPVARGQARGNSGVYLQGLYEVQVLDSFGIRTPGSDDCGALYGCYPPATNACLPPEQWQSYDIRFISPKFNEAGTTTRQGRITVVHNGIKVIDNQQLKGPTRGAMDGDPNLPGPLMLQDHGNTVAYRNVWLIPFRGPVAGSTAAAMVEITQEGVGLRGPLAMALKLYRLHTGNYPKGEDGLRQLIEKPKDPELAKKWKGPYLSEDGQGLQDVWDQPFRYRYPGKSDPSGFDLWSVGPDRQDGTDDDIWP